MASQRQINANRANALKSTGPKSPGGKAISRANAYQHGLAGKGVVEDEATQREIAAKTEAWRTLYNLVDEKDEIAYAEMVVSSVKYNRALREESFLTAFYIDRARFMWEADRQVEASEMAAGLAKNPELAVLRLQSCAHGCDWLIHRWNQLLRILEDGKSWDDTHRALMSDLAGIPHEFRPEDTGDELDREATKGYVREQIAMLEGFKEKGLTEFDKAEQAGAEQGFFIKVPKPLLRVQRHLRQHLLGFKSATATLKRAHRCAGYNHAAERNDSYYSQTMSTLAKPLQAASQKPVNFSNDPDSFDMKLLAGETPIPAREALVAVAAASRHENRQSRRARTKRESR